MSELQMNLRRLHFLLVLWCLLVTVPGLLVARGLFGYVHSLQRVGGPASGVWIAGYIAQFGVFLWITRIVGEQRILWWLVASLAVWGMDWTLLGHHPLYALLVLAAVIGTSLWIAAVAGRSESLRKHGVQAVGVVVEVLNPFMNVVINNVYIKRKVRLRLERRDGVPPYEGILNGLFMIGKIPSPGDRLPLLVDPKRPGRFAYDNEARDAAVVTSRASSPGNFVDELGKLTALHERGALTDTEYAAAKEKLLRS